MRIAFFNNKGGVGKTTLVYHITHMLVHQGRRVLLLDLDPQSNLTAMCVDEERLEQLWPADSAHRQTILGAIRPILRGIGDIEEPHVEELNEGLGLVPGDLGLSTVEDKLADAWPRALDRQEHAFRPLTAPHRLASRASLSHRADITLLDVGPGLGAINRAALLAADFVVTPLAPDLYSMQGLRHLGPTLIEWRRGWSDRIERSPDAELDLPKGRMQPLGYVIMQAGMRLSRPIKAYERWLEGMPMEYRQAMLRSPGAHAGEGAPTAARDPWCLGIMRHYPSLMPLAQDARRPLFELRPADGAVGSHMDAVRRCREDFEALAGSMLSRVEQLDGSNQETPR